MSARLHWIALLLLICGLAHHFLIWGGAASTPQVGLLLKTAAAKEAPLRRFYMAAGEWLGRAIGLEGYAVAAADRALGPAYPDVLAKPEAAMDVLSGRSVSPGHTLLKANEWGTPGLLVAFVLLYLRRSKAVHLSKRR